MQNKPFCDIMMTKKEDDKMKKDIKKFPKITIIGAGLAGSEACYQLAKRGYNIDLYEMRPKKMTPAHTTAGFAELICSNSLRAASLENAVGLLKEEMRLLDSLIMEAADRTRVEAGGALAVNRVLFSKYITEKLQSFPNVNIINEELKTIPQGKVIIASGPLTSDDLYKEIQKMIGEDSLYFFDAVAPIIDAKTINYDKVYLASRYNKGEAAYLNAPFTKEEFDAFYDYLINAECVVPHDFELKVFEGCMPIEEMAKRGRQTILFGPMKPVGLDDPKTGRWPYAVVQLRKENKNGTMYNLVGFQTHLKYKAQEELLKYIPGLENAKILRYGVMHRNTYINGPKVLNEYFQMKNNKDIFFAGQMTGVEGYVESAASGLVAALNMDASINEKAMIDFKTTTSIGSLAHHVAVPTSEYVPMNANFGLFKPLDDGTKKLNRKKMYKERALHDINELIKEHNLNNNYLHDQHVHSHYSVDSEAKIEDYLSIAANKGCKYFVLTDHIDYMRDYATDWLVDYERLEMEEKKLSLLYPNITFLKGVEIGYRFKYMKDIDDILNQNPFDLVICSVHYKDGIDYYYEDEVKKIGVEQFLTQYFNNVLEAVEKMDNYDVLGHFDYGFKTAYLVDHNLKITSYEEIIKKIFKVIIEKQKALEINTKVQGVLGFEHLKEVLKLYKTLGGERITLSSDAHTKERYLKDFDKYLKVIKEAGYDYLCYYINRVERHYYI